MSRLLRRAAAFWAIVVVPASAVDFEKDIEPVFKKRCLVCHGARQQMNGFRLDDGPAALKGGYSGVAIVPGSSGTSKIVERVTSAKSGFSMPPAGPKLTEAEIDALKKWIDEGARYPVRAAKQEAPKPVHWSFQPVSQPAPPEVRQRAWVRNPIDRFVLGKIESLNIEPSAEASRTTLLRRVSFDLRGLPPTPAEIDEFLKDNRPDAYERMVDRFLASPQFGERWARPWLDLAHYADSDGFEKDLIRPWAWRWRQWVIDALNRDQPFDQFTIEQLAGDLLPGGTMEQRVATGFLRQTLTNREAGVARAEDRFEQLVNRTNTIGTTWLGLTVGCAQCHNHKYDAFTQQDFYQLVAVFNSSMEQTMDAPLAGEMGPWLRDWPAYEKKRQQLLDEYLVADYQAGWEEKMRKAVRKPGEDLEYDFWVTSMRVMLDHAERILLKPAAERTPREAWALTEYFIGNPGPDLSRDKGTAEHFKSLRGHLAELNRTLTPLTQAYVMEEDPQAGKTFLAVKGDYKRPGVEVQPATPASLPPMQRANGEPARLAFARWLVSKDNPLTPRVIANRTWQELFGVGLVKTSEDFGVMGEKPSHPELLDWLAGEFRDRGWSQKQLIRVIVTSATYRQSSNARPDLAERDPENRLLARQNRLRLPAEAIRDAALSAGGLLNPQVGGRSVMPPMPAGVGELTYGGNKWKESQGTDRYRRGLYIHFQRTAPYPQLANFDAPDMQVACSRRRRSNTPLQSLNLLNDPVFFEAAQGLAARAEGEGRGAFTERLDYVFQLALGRKPTARERERFARFFDEQSQLIAKEQSSAKLMAAQPEAAPWVAVSRVLLNLDEFMVKE